MKTLMDNFQILLHVNNPLSSHYKHLCFHVHNSGTDLSEPATLKNKLLAYLMIIFSALFQISLVLWAYKYFH